MSNALVIIPTYNEKENIQAIVDEVLSLPKDFHLLIVDDNSPDGTADLVKGLQTKYNALEIRLHLLQRTGKLGLGTAYIEGFKFGLKKGYHYLLEMDADFSHNPKDLTRLYLACEEEGHDLAVGSRYSKGVNVVNWPMSRVLMSYFASKYVRFITGLPIHDTTAGFVCYRRKVLESIDLDRIQFIGYAFQIEMKFASWRLGFKIAEVPIVFRDRKHGASKMSKGIIKEGITGVFAMQWQYIFGDYQKRIRK